MATEHASSVTSEVNSFGKWANWLAALVGLWVMVTPFVITGIMASGTAFINWVAGILIFVLAGFGVYSIRRAPETKTNSIGEVSGWVAALVGIWVLVTPFMLTGPISSGTVKWSNIVAGVVVLLLAGFAGYTLHSAG